MAKSLANPFHCVKINSNFEASQRHCFPLLFCFVLFFSLFLCYCIINGYIRGRTSLLQFSCQIWSIFSHTINALIKLSNHVKDVSHIIGHGQTKEMVIFEEQEVASLISQARHIICVLLRKREWECESFFQKASQTTKIRERRLMAPA